MLYPFRCAACGTEMDLEFGPLEPMVESWNQEHVIDAAYARGDLLPCHGPLRRVYTAPQVNTGPTMRRHNGEGTLYFKGMNKSIH